MTVLRNGREVVRRARPRPEAHQAHDDERDAEDRDVGRHQVAHVSEQVLCLQTGGLGRGEPRQRSATSVSRRESVKKTWLLSCACREAAPTPEAGYQRLFRQRRMFGKVAAHGPDAERQHDIDDRHAPRLGEP
jgi:hypothetical protein